MATGARRVRESMMRVRGEAVVRLVPGLVLLAMLGFGAAGCGDGGDGGDTDGGETSGTDTAASAGDDDDDDSDDDDDDDDVTGNATGDETGGETGDETGGETGDETGDETGGQTGGETDTGETGEETGGETDTGETDGETEGETGGETGEEVAAEIEGPRYVDVGANVTFRAVETAGALGYAWDFGNGTTTERSTNPEATVSYATRGRFTVTLTVFTREASDAGAVIARANVTAIEPVTFAPVSSSSVITLPRYNIGIEVIGVAAVSPDSDELVAVNAAGGFEGFDTRDDGVSGVTRLATCDGPRSVARYDYAEPAPDCVEVCPVPYSLVVACENSDEVWRYPVWGTAGEPEKFQLPYGSRPFGVIAHGQKIYVTLQATGEVAVLENLDTDAMPVTRLLPALPDPRAIALLPSDGGGVRLAVARFRSPETGAELIALDPATGVRTPFSLQLDPQRASDTEIGGVPSYLTQVAVSPTGRDAAVASLQANFGHGPFRNGEASRNDFVLRATASFFDPTTLAETFTRRKQFDNRGFASAATYSARGDYLYLTTRGARTVERFDVLRGAQAGTILDVGYAPQGVAVASDADGRDRYLFVDAYLSRELRVYDITTFGPDAALVAAISLVTSEPLDATLLLGKRLFNDSSDMRLADDAYLACAHCHLDGESDNRVWDFTGRGEGLRNTTSLLGRAGMGHGPVHWSANFDEIQDFENDIRGHFGGRGLMSDVEFNAGTRRDPLGDAKAGVNEELDALAAYVASLDTYRRSPYRNDDGSLSEAALRGKVLFETPGLGCVTCHTGPNLTDSQFVAGVTPLLHDVGTLSAGSGKRRGATLTGIDTPTLYDLWATAPYLHDGSAATLVEVLTTRNASDQHGITSTLTPEELDDLVEYLLSLDGTPE